jgi:hypothetical protein
MSKITEMKANLPSHIMAKYYMVFLYKIKE